MTQTSPRLAMAMAEAHFRLALREPSLAAAHLEKGRLLQPNDARFLYFLGLDAQRRHEFDKAIDFYEQTLAKDKAFAQRAALPLALLLAAKGGQVEKTAVWPYLSPQQQNDLQLSRAFAKKQYRVTDTDPVVWQGLAAVANGRFEDAITHLTQSAKEPTAAGISHYYLGVIAAQQEDMLTAAQHWAAAVQAKFAHPHLAANLGEVYHRIAEERLEADNIEGALDAATEAYRFKEDKPLNELISYLQQLTAYDAAKRDDWETAASLWEMAEEQAGGNFRLICNLALAREREDDFYEAAELWRQALRRRPRKDTHPDAISDEQVSRLWQRTAAAYQKVGHFDEALNVQKNAVKWQPDNLALRLELADGYLENGRFQAAQNEVERILERDANHIPALMLMGEVIQEGGRYWWGANPVVYWERVLAIEPNHADARQSLIDYYLERGDHFLGWRGAFGSHALEAYEKALQYDPTNGIILSKLGYCRLLDEEIEAGEAFFERALAQHPQDVNVYIDIITNWLAVDNVEKAQQIAERAEQAIPDLLPDVYVNIAGDCFYNRQAEQAEMWLDKAIAIAKDDTVYVKIGEMAMFVPGAVAVGTKYLKIALEKGVHPGQVHLILGVLASKQGNRDEADRHWREALKIARTEGDRELQERVEQAKIIFGSPLGSLFSRFMGGQVGPEQVLDLLPPDLVDELFGDDEWEEDDDDWF